MFGYSIHIQYVGMNAIRSVIKDFVIFFNPKARIGRIRIGALALVVVAAAVFLTWGGESAPEETDEQLREVRVAAAGSFESSAPLSLIGTVEAVNEAAIQTEAGGRVTSVRVGLGDQVRAGQTIATLENAAQYASLLQAEGSYEAALAAAAQSDIGVGQAEVSLTEAKNNAVSVVRGAYTAANSAVRNEIDTFFTSPDAQSTPGLRLQGYGYTSYLNNERVAFQTILTQWRGEVDTLDASDDLKSALSDAEQRIERVIEMVETFIILLNDQDAGAYTQSELATYSSTFTALRASLNAQLSAIANARTTLQNAEDALDRAQISGTGGGVSAADASVKQALGALRAAQANYQKTIIASPIAGTVNTLSVKSGDYVGMAAPVALIANNNALVITTHVNEGDRDRISIGDSVEIEGGASGTIVRIAPAIDPATGKIEVHIGVDNEDDLKNGDVITLTLSPAATSVVDEPADATLRLPLSAFKILPDGPVAFTVSGENRLESHQVTLGPIEGDTVVVLEGLSRDMEIVADARGLQEGMEVAVIR